jgi:hypothetical protein
VSATGYWRFGARSGKHDDLVLAVAIALWRAHGTTKGIIEHYRQMAMGTRRDAAAPAAADVVLRAPKGAAATSTVQTAGASYIVNRDGCVVVSAEDAELLIRSGWQRVEQPA